VRREPDYFYSFKGLSFLKAWPGQRCKHKQRGGKKKTEIKNSAHQHLAAASVAVK
jgi:hypothetical protein